MNEKQLNRIHEALSNDPDVQLIQQIMVGQEKFEAMMEIESIIQRKAQAATQPQAPPPRRVDRKAPVPRQAVPQPVPVETEDLEPELDVLEDAATENLDDDLEEEFEEELPEMIEPAPKPKAKKVKSETKSKKKVDEDMDLDLGDDYDL